MVDESGRLLAGEPVGVGVGDASSDLADPITVGGRCRIKPLGAVWVECVDPTKGSWRAWRSRELVFSIWFRLP